MYVSGHNIDSTLSSEVLFKGEMYEEKNIH